MTTDNPTPSTPARTIRPATTMKCQQCMTTARIPIAITTDNIPCVVQCIRCKHLIEWKVVPILPKLIPQGDLPNYLVYESTTLSEIQEWFLKKDLAQLEADASEPPGNTPENSGSAPSGSGAADIAALLSGDEEPTPFFQQAKEIGESTKNLFRQISHLTDDIVKFRETIGRYFQNQWEFAEAFHDKWAPQHLQEFMEYPFVSCKIDCEDELAAKYARLIIAPKFFSPGLGIKAMGKGGFRLEVVNQYTRMNEGFSRSFLLESCKMLNVPETLDLMVRGNKIIGSSVQFCWQDIPGTAEDLDSTPQLRSIYMTNPFVARCWLAQHGVIPWEPRRISEFDLSTQHLDQDIAEVPGYLDVWRKFVHTGRVGIFWDSAMAARRLAVLMAYMIKGVTPIFVVGEHDTISWKHLYDAVDIHRKERQYNIRTNAVYIKNGDPVIWDSVMKTRMVIVDMHSSKSLGAGGDGNGAAEIDCEILERLMRYEGKVIVIGNDPFMDFATENVRALYVNALAPWQFYEPAKWESWPGRRIGVELLKEMLRRGPRAGE